MTDQNLVSRLLARVADLEAQLEAATIWERSRAEQLRTMQDELTAGREVERLTRADQERAEWVRDVLDASAANERLLATRAEQAERERDALDGLNNVLNQTLAAEQLQVIEWREKCEQAERQVREIRELHAPTRLYGPTSPLVCSHCMDSDANQLPYPCPTAALSGVSEPNDEGMESDDRPEPSSPHTAW